MTVAITCHDMETVSNSFQEINTTFHYFINMFTPKANMFIRQLGCTHLCTFQNFDNVELFKP